MMCETFSACLLIVLLGLGALVVLGVALLHVAARVIVRLLGTGDD